MSLKYEPASEPFRVPGSETWGVELRGTGEATLHLDILPRQVDARQPGKGKANSYGARPVHLIVTMMKWTRTSRMSIKNSPPNGLARKVDVRLLKKREIRFSWREAGPPNRHDGEVDLDQ